MTFSGADLKMVDDHIAQGVRHVARQEELVAWLKERGHPTEVAEDLLVDFEATLLQHRAHRDRLMHERDEERLRAIESARARPKDSRLPRQG
jgi:hypothetical protein